MGLIFFAFFEKFFVPILTSGGLAAVSSSAFAALYSAFGKYDVVHIHAEGPAFFAWLPKMFGKRVVGEDLVWVRMARKYEMVHINKAIYVGNYLEDGLTNNRRKHNIASPVGCMHRAEEFMESDLKTRYRIKGGLQYIVYGRFAGVKICDLIY